MTDNKYVQDCLPGFLQEEAEAREKSIPPEARREHLSRLYWRFRKMASKCPKNDWDNRRRAWQCLMILERQR